ncbi:hypothetical protein FV226_22760 [Methylobacterium sp. WL12]|uniref:hypothetical protein n=1 Tax=Methylobacterium sp. WL12 TaxID=2603890 RepID=UPI0011C85928|nr:hypothetical protein [Methylobacterium sp. WL12]TXM66902.1 hypothetical protein FV226_22760 [Methylobacterium sp. WL12]
MPTQRDYMIATVLGEDNRGSPQGQAAIIDSIFNRQAAIMSGRRAPGYYEANSPSIQDIVTANRGNQYNTWKGTPAEAGNAARAARALQGRDATSGTERQQYDQIAKIYDEYLAGEGGWQGISQGATFYQTPKSAEDGSFQNKFYRDGGGNENYQDIGSHRFSGETGQYFKDKNAFYAANPQMYNPNTGAGYDASSPLNPGIGTQGPGDFFGEGNGSLGNAAGTVETGNPFGFSQGNFAGNVGNGSLGSGIIPNQSIDGFGNGFNVGGGDPGSFGQFNGTMETGGGLGFAGGFNPSAYLAANPDVAAAGVDPLQHWLRYGQAEGRPLGTQGQSPTINPFGFSAADASGGVGNGSLGQPLDSYPDTSATAFGGGFDPSAYLAANPDVAAAGVDPLQHWLRYGQAEGRPLTPNANPFTGNANSAPDPISADFSGSPLSPIDAGNPIAYPDAIQGNFGSPLNPVPTGPNVSQGVGPGTFHGTFNGADYLAANPDVAAQHVDPLQHYLTYGFQEGRALDPQGDRVSQGFNPSQYLQTNPDVAASGVNPLQHYLQYGAHEGRSADFSGGVGPGSFGAGIYQPASVGSLGLDPAASIFIPGQINADFSGSPLSPVDTGNPIATPASINADFGSPLSPAPTGPNVSAGVGPGSFHGTFNAADYLAANPDVAAQHVDPLQHYLTYGFNEGRALDTAGDRINQGFNPSQYFNANPDAAASGVSALQHYIQYGAHEGRAADFSGGVSPGNFGAGITPYAPAPGPMDFSGSNVSQGLGAMGNGAFGLGSGGGYNAPSPYSFSGGNFGGGLGAQPQSTGGYYPAGGGQSGGGGIDPYGFSSQNVGGFDANSFGGGSGGAGGGEDFAAGTKDFNLSPGFEPTASEDFSSGQGDYSGEYGGGGFNPQASEMAFLRGQLDQQYAANARLAASNDTNIAFANQGAAQANQLNAVGAGNAARQFAGIQAGLGIAPVPGTSFAPGPVGIQTIGGIGPMNFGLAGLGGAPLRGFF